MSIHDLVMPMFQLEPKHDAPQRWNRWIDRFDNYILATAIDEPTRQRALLLHLIWEEMYSIFKTLKEDKPDTTKQETVYNTAKQALSEYFSPKLNLEYEIFNFREATQSAGEDLDTYYYRLKQLSVNCKFKNPDAEIKSQIIQRGTLSKLREEGLCKPEWKLEDLLKYGRTLERSKLHSKVMEEKIQIKGSTAGSYKPVQKVSQHKNPQNKQFNTNSQSKSSPAKGGKKCYNCGNSWPHPRGSSCPAYGKTCSKCGQQNHFAAQCRTAVKKKTKSVKTLEEEHASHASEYSLEEFGIGEMAIEDESETKVYNCDMLINGVKTVFEIDTGASTTIINESEYQKLCHPKAKPVLQKSDIVLKTYTGEIVKPAGCAMVSVGYNGDQQKKLLLTVVPGKGPNLLGRDWLSQIKIDWTRVIHSVRTSSIEEDSNSIVDEVLKAYADVFNEELGCLVSKKVSLCVAKDASPVYYKARPLPFSIKPKVLEELERLEKDKVIRPVEHSDWATPIVPVLKSNGDIRICGDYKLTVNKYAKPDCYPLPLIEELFSKLSGGVIFTKLDHSHAYQQLPLDEDSQMLTTINTPKGLYVYNRLPFGVSAAPGIFQRTGHSDDCHLPR